MQYYLDHREINFSEFEKLFPKEAKILKKFSLDECKIIIKNKKLEIKYKDFSEFKIEIQKKADYHLKSFTNKSIYKDPLAKALGLKKGGSIPEVLDATAGFLGDSILIKSFGVKSLTCYENNPLLAALIVNSLSEAKWGIDFVFDDVVNNRKDFDCIYFDPMYEDYNDKAAPKKEMQILRDINFKQSSVEDVFNHLFAHSINRLVVKRPLKSRFLIENPDFSISGKSTRFDVYLKEGK